MMDIAERLPRERGTTHTSPALAERLITLLDQPTEGRVRGLVRLCRQLSLEYQKAPEACLARSWWRLFNQTGVHLREALDEARADGYPGLKDWEVEQAYFLLIHVAYFFESGGLVERLWPLLTPEPGDQQMLPARSSALGVSFGAPPQVHTLARLWEALRHWWRRLSQILGRSPSREKGAAALQQLAAYGPPPLDEDIARSVLEQ